MKTITDYEHDERIMRLVDLFNSEVNHPALWRYNNKLLSSIIRCVSDGAFDSLGVDFVGSHLSLNQKKLCDWSMSYFLMTHLLFLGPMNRHSLLLPFTPDRMTEEVRRMNYYTVTDALEEGYISCDAKLLDDGNVFVERCVYYDYGDEDGFGADDFVYIQALFDKDGHQLKPFEVQP